VLSPTLLVLARLLQGLSVGGEYGASATYISEMAGESHRGFWSGFLYVTLIGGQLAAVLLQVLLQHLLTEDQMYAWGWRVPFVVGAALAVIVFWIRRGIHETTSFTRAAATAGNRGEVLRLFTDHPRETAIVMALTAGGGLGFYTYTTYMQKFLVNTAGIDKPVASQVMTAVLATFLLFQPIAGWLSDVFGRKRTLAIAFGASALVAVPVLSAIATVQSPLEAYLLCLVPLLCLSGYTALSAIIKAELYPAHVRALGVAVPYALAMAIFGGNAEAAALYFKGIGFESAYFWLVATIMAMSCVVALRMRDTRLHSRIED
jgi:MHS family alpha-ketoglutarate permease-like MFS transporter